MDRPENELNSTEINTQGESTTEAPQTAAANEQALEASSEASDEATIGDESAAE